MHDTEVCNLDKKSEKTLDFTMQNVVYLQYQTTTKPKNMKTATEILVEKGHERSDANDIVYSKLDIEVRELYNVLDHPVHLWEKYVIGDANENDLLRDAESNTTPVKKYNDVDELFEDMTNELERLASIYE